MDLKWSLKFASITAFQRATPQFSGWREWGDCRCPRCFKQRFFNNEFQQYFCARCKQAACKMRLSWCYKSKVLAIWLSAQASDVVTAALHVFVMCCVFEYRSHTVNSVRCCRRWMVTLRWGSKLEPHLEVQTPAVWTSAVWTPAVWTSNSSRRSLSPVLVYLLISVAVLAEISLRSPRILFIFIIKKYIYRIKVSKK